MTEAIPSAPEFRRTPHTNLGAGALLILQDHVLLVCLNYGRFKGSWIQPGGSVEPGEHPEETAVREFLEETGVAIELDRLLAVRHRNLKDLTSDVYWIFQARLARKSEIALQKGFPRLQWPAEELIEARFWPLQTALQSPEVRPLTKHYLKMALAKHSGFQIIPAPSDYGMDDTIYGFSVTTEEDSRR